MTSIRELTRLQSVDAETVNARAQLEEVERQLADTAALEELREQAVVQKQAVSELERELRTAEWEADQTKAHVSEEEGKLYGGKVRNPKELMDLQHEINSLKSHQTQQEDAALEVMTRFEAETAKLEELGRELASIEAERRDLEDRLSSERDQLLAQIQGLTDQRGRLVGQVPQKDLGLYENLLNVKQGRAVARMERSICQGCRTNLPMVVQQRVRSNQALVQCPSCGRILYMD